MPIVEVPGQGNVEFPDTMSDEDISKVISSSTPKPSFGDKLEETISPTGGEENFVTSPHGLIRTGARQIVHGARELMTEGQRKVGASDVFRGGMKVLAPAAIPFAVSNPPAAALALGGGTIGAGLGETAAGFTGGDEGTQRLAGDIGGLVGAGRGVNFGTKVFPTARTAQEIGGMIRGGMQGVKEGATRMLPLSRYGHHMEVPAPVAGAGMGELAGWMSRIPGAPKVGAVVGGAWPIAKGGFEGAKKGILDLRNPWEDYVVRDPGEAAPISSSPNYGIKVRGVTNKYSSAPPGEEIERAETGNSRNPPIWANFPEGKPPEAPIPIKVNPPSLPSGRVPGKMPTEAQEFGPVNVQVTAQAPAQQAPTVQAPIKIPQVKYPGHSAIKRVDTGIANKVPNIIAHAKAEGYTIEDLKTLQDEALQADDVAKQANAISKLKELGKGAFHRARKEGRVTNPSESPYRGLSLDTLQEVIKAWPKD